MKRFALSPWLFAALGVIVPLSVALSKPINRIGATQIIVYSSLGVVAIILLGVAMKDARKK